MCKDFRKDKLGTSHSGREKRSGADIDQVRSYSGGMIRDVGSVCLSLRLSLSFSACGRQETEERSRYELQIGLYVCTYWPDAPRVTHTCVAKSLRHCIASTIRKRERYRGRTGREDGPRD